MCLLPGLGVTHLLAQNKKPRLVHRTVVIEVIPGFGTAGLNPGTVSSNFSLNLFGGYRFKNEGIELSGLASAHVAGTRGLQLSGIANITGINAEVSPFLDENAEINLTGIQFAGIHNYVRNYTYGAQISAVYNNARNLLGFQLGMINRLRGFGIGAQAGLLYNWSYGSFDGVQAIALINETNNRLVGLQVGGVNIAGTIEGKNSDQGGKYTALQLGMVNKAATMHGFQVGLVNIAGKMRGTQIGLINIGNRRDTPAGVRDGTMIGLLNIGFFHSLKASVGELFLYNISLETGNLKNGNMRGQVWNKYITSEIEYGFSPIVNESYRRSYGVIVHKYYYNRTTTPGMNEKWFFEGSLGLRYLQTDEESFDPNNAYSSFGLGTGYRLFDKLSLYVVVQASLNYAWDDFSVSVPPTGASTIGDGLLWPGWRAGIQIH